MDTSATLWTVTNRNVCNCSEQSEPNTNCQHKFEPIFGIGVNPLGYNCIYCGINKEEVVSDNNESIDWRCKSEISIDWSKIHTFFTPYGKIEFIDDDEYYKKHFKDAIYAPMGTIPETLNYIADSMNSKYGITDLVACRYIDGIDLVMLVGSHNGYEARFSFWAATVI